MHSVLTTNVKQNKLAAIGMLICSVKSSWTLQRGYLTLCPPRAENRHPASYRGSGNTQLSCALQYLYLRSHWANKARLLFAPLCLPSFFTQGICQHLLSMLSGQTCKIPESRTQAVYLVKLISMTRGIFFSSGVDHQLSTYLYFKIHPLFEMY